MWHYHALHLSHGTSNLHTRRTAANHHHGHQFLQFQLVCRHLCLLQILQQCVAQLHRLCHRLHGQGILLYILITKEVSRGTSSYHQIVVVHRAERGLQCLLFTVYALHFTHAKEEILPVLQRAAEGK